MQQPPRNRDTSLFEPQETWISIVQGLVIAGGVLGLFYYYSLEGYSLQVVRTIVFTTLILSNIFLTFTNRSFEHTLAKTIHYKNNLALPVLLLSAAFLAALHLLPFVQRLFGLMPISLLQFSVCLGTALLCVGWFEGYKLNLRSIASQPITDRSQAFP